MRFTRSLLAPLVAAALSAACGTDAAAQAPPPDLPGTAVTSDLPPAPPALFWNEAVWLQYLGRVLGTQNEAAAEAARYARRYSIGRDLAATIYRAAVREGLDPDLAFRLVRVESRFKVRARGPAGALGLTQLMPSTARALDRSLRSEEQIIEPSTNLRLGFGYLRSMIERYHGDVRLGLLAYNRGLGTVDRHLRRGRDPENGYSRKVLSGGGGYRGPGLLPETGSRAD